MTSLEIDQKMHGLLRQRGGWQRTEEPNGSRPLEATSRKHDAWRRALSVVVAALGLVALAPIMALVAVAIKLTSPGPVLYTQMRVGLDRRAHRNGNGRVSRRQNDAGGQPFSIIKFRTMTVQEDRDTEVWASPDDPRVTRVGRFLRLYRLDELPQLWNVLVGDMNIVGPRPEQPQIFQRLRGKIDQYDARQQVRPGITGWAQINHHYDTSVEDVKRKVAFDLEYIERQSFAEDLRIMMRTVPVIVARKGAW